MGKLRETEAGHRVELGLDACALRGGWVRMGQDALNFQGKRWWCIEIVKKG